VRSGEVPPTATSEPRIQRLRLFVGVETRRQGSFSGCVPGGTQHSPGYVRLEGCFSKPLKKLVLLAATIVIEGSVKRAWRIHFFSEVLFTQAEKHRVGFGPRDLL